MFLPHHFHFHHISSSTFFPQYWEKAEFPFQIVPKLGALRISQGLWMPRSLPHWKCYCSHIAIGFLGFLFVFEG
ncbi:hypothetical protein ERO13_D05G383733v2 [Gossypium hirsutum]|uniref:Uncharacterized protein n=3 Tax=Gossypium TaxID=3633 RepID=A0A5J5RPA5_GOSBA|nr:hypothetical protein ES319_D05G423700v1 [Gossypium barbadense]KAG4150239.1 hypothetical protein ERO13_D05G383733v2 [Gossypium hirsutum]TYI85414.1 hypothetical protein E1A91_D05G440600v1 [Gossypium mustelinum]